MDNSGSTVLRKRKRLSTACNRCRSRKVACDERLPACTNCHKAQVECLTRHPRQPSVEVQRRQAPSYGSPAVHSDDVQTANANSPVDAHERFSTASTRIPANSHAGTPKTSHDAANGMFAGALLAVPGFRSGNCLSMLTQWLDLAFARLGLPDRFSRLPEAGKAGRPDRCLVEGIQPNDESFWAFDSKPLLNSFLSNINLVFPLVDADEEFQAESTMRANRPPTAESIFYQLVVAMVWQEALSVGQVDKGSRILAFAFSHLTQLVQDESITSVKAFILMALLFRSRDDAEMARRMLSIAVPKAQALAIDRPHSIQRHRGDRRGTARQEFTTWWSLFILDKVLAVELQRPPMIRDQTYDHDLIASPDDNEEAKMRQTCFDAIVNLSQIQSLICERLLLCTRDEEAGKLTLEQAIKAKMQASGELDQLLLNWAKELPDELK